MSTWLLISLLLLNVNCCGFVNQLTFVKVIRMVWHIHFRHIHFKLMEDSGIVCIGLCVQLTQFCYEWNSFLFEYSIPDPNQWRFSALCDFFLCLYVELMTMTTVTCFSFWAACSASIERRCIFCHVLCGDLRSPNTWRSFVALKHAAVICSRPPASL